jgi:hypothetical protein
MRQMVAVLDDAAGVDTAVRGLGESGVEPGTITILSGPEGARLLDRTGGGHGLGGRLLRLLQWTASEGNALELHERALRDGSSVVFVPARGEADKKRVAAALRTAGGHDLVYFGRWTLERLPGGL